MFGHSCLNGKVLIDSVNAEFGPRSHNIPTHITSNCWQKFLFACEIMKEEPAQVLKHLEAIP